MFINDVNKKEEIRTIAIRHLRKYGIKYRDKNPKQFLQVTKCKKFFKVPLQNLAKETVTLKNGQQLVVPKRLYEICSFIFSKVETEGIFRKEGSKSRQNEIKLLLDRGCQLGDDHHVIDVAVVLKCFLRELPEPLIPYTYHELFLRCSLIEKKIETILLACLLLPSEHLNVLSFLMQFLNEIANHAKYNKMDTYNIAVVIGPNIFPIGEKLAPKNKLMVTKICDIIKLMIEQSRNIGLIPEYIIEQIHSSTEVDIVDKIKRRRSGSLTRIFNGLKKIVGNRPDEETAITTVTPDLLLTPSINSSKKCEDSTKSQKKLRLKDEHNAAKRNGTKTALERRWSAITHATTFKRKKRNSSAELPHREATNYSTDSKNMSKGEYVKVSKKEYEEIKNRVTAIEKRLSLEFENIQSTVSSDNENMDVDNIQNIQSAYEQTLVQAEPLCSGTDQIARRLSRELRIRNSEQKMIRSPSARKIGNMRRRSRELEKPNKLVRNQSLHYRDVGMNQLNSKLTRNGPSTTRSDSRLNETYLVKNSIDRPLRQSSSFHNNHKLAHTYRNSRTRMYFHPFDQSPENGGSGKSSLTDVEMICDDDIFLSELKKSETGHTDLYENVTLEKKLLPEVYHTELKPRQSFSNKVLHKVKQVQDKGVPKQSGSPIRRNNNLKQRGKHQYTEIKRLSKSNKENDFMFEDNVLDKTVTIDNNCTPKILPHIKRPIIIKSSKRLCSTPQKLSRNTPIKVLSSSNSYSPGVY